MLISLKDGMYQVRIINVCNYLANYFYFRTPMSSLRLPSSTEFLKLIEFLSKRNSTTTTTKIKREKWKLKMKKMHEKLCVSCECVFGFRVRKG